MERFLDGVLVRSLLTMAAQLVVLPTAWSDDWSEGRALFKSACVTCHGATVAGPGPNSGIGLSGYANNTAALQLNINNAPSAAMRAASGVQALSSCVSGTYPCTSTSLPDNDAVRKLGVYLEKPDRGAGSLSASASVAFTPSLPAGRNQFSYTVDVTLTALHDPDRSIYLPDYGNLVVNAVTPSDTTNFELISNGCVTTLTPNTPTDRCTYSFRFRPQQVGTFTNRSLTFAHNGSNPSATTGNSHVLSAISGTAFEPRPVYEPGAGFAALSSGFTTDTAGSVTLCPTISNGGLYDDLIVSISALMNGGTDYTGYYEIDNSPTACTSPPARCLPSGAVTVTGNFTIASSASCTLAIKFNPGKIGFSGGIGSRPATLRVAHDGYTTTSPAPYLMGGVVSSGPTPRIGVSTTPSRNAANQVLPLSFASQVVGIPSASWGDFAVGNTGTADGLQIASVTQSNPDEFTLTENCKTAGALARLSNGGASCRISLVFTPAAAPAGLGSRCTVVTVRATLADIADESVEICGTGVPVPVPAMTIDPALIDFGRRSIGASYLSRELVIANAAGATAGLKISAVSISGSGFAFVPDAMTCAGRTLAAGTQCRLALQFTPGITPEMPYAADVVIDTNDPNTPRRTVRLTATAVAASLPVLQWQSGLTAVTFSDLVAAGQSAAAPQVARLVNAGPGATDVQAVKLIGADASSFSASSCPAQLHEGDSCDIRIGFQPGSGGAKQARLQITSTGGVVPDTLPVSGQAVGGNSPFLVASATSVAFSDVRIGGSSNPTELRLTAAGDGVVTVNALTVDGPFDVTPTSCPRPPFALRLGDECSVAVRFRPTDGAIATGTLTVSADAPARALAVVLEGQARPRPDVSGGGCSLVDGRQGAADPTLWLLAVAAAIVLWCRWRATPRPAISNAEGEAR